MFSKERLKRLRAYLLLAAAGLLASLVSVNRLALVGVFLILIEFCIYMHRTFRYQAYLKEVCDFYNQAHSLGDLNILQNDERPFKTLLKAVTELGGFDWSVLFLMNFEKDRFEAAESDGIDLLKFAPVNFDELEVGAKKDQVTLSAKLLEYAFKKHDLRGALAGSVLEKNGTFYGCLLVGRLEDDADLAETDSLRLNILSDQIAISLHNYYLHKEIAERAQALSEQRDRTQKELFMARLVQEGAMSREKPGAECLEIASYWNPARFIGGDFLRFMQDDKGRRLGIFIGDVCGKGIPAALVMAVVVSLFKEKVSLDKSPEKLLNEINVSLKDFLGAGSHFNSTAFWGIFNSRKMTFRYGSAGHDFPLHLRARDNSIEELVSTGTLLGIFKESEYALVETEVEEGDKIIFYSDGLVDFFEFNLGYEDNYEELKKFFLARITKTSDEIVNEISQMVENTKEPIKDDITVAVFSVVKHAQ